MHPLNTTFSRNTCRTWATCANVSTFSAVGWDDVGVTTRWELNINILLNDYPAISYGGISYMSLDPNRFLVIIPYPFHNLLLQLLGICSTELINLDTAFEKLKCRHCCDTMFFSCFLRQNGEQYQITLITSHLDPDTHFTVLLKGNFTQNCSYQHSIQFFACNPKSFSMHYASIKVTSFVLSGGGLEREGGLTRKL